MISYANLALMIASVIGIYAIIRSKFTLDIFTIIIVSLFIVAAYYVGSTFDDERLAKINEKRYKA